MVPFMPLLYLYIFLFWVKRGLVLQHPGNFISTRLLDNTIFASCLACLLSFRINTISIWFNLTSWSLGFWKCERFGTRVVCIVYHIIGYTHPFNKMFSVDQDRYHLKISLKLTCLFFKFKFIFIFILFHLLFQSTTITTITIIITKHTCTNLLHT